MVWRDRAGSGTASGGMAISTRFDERMTSA
jgi:hypothetical protein